MFRLGWCLVSVFRNGLILFGKLFGVWLLVLFFFGSMLILKLKF